MNNWTTTPLGLRTQRRPAIYDMHAENLIASRVQHLMDMLKNNPIVMTMPQMYGIQYSAKPWIRRLPMTEVLTIMQYDEQRLVLNMRPPVPRTEDIMRSRVSETCPTRYDRGFLGHVARQCNAMKTNAHKQPNQNDVCMQGYKRLQ